MKKIIYTFRIQKQGFCASVILLAWFCLPTTIKAQIEVISNGDVGVGTVTPPQAKLDLNGSWRWQPQGAHPLWLVRVADGNGNMETVDPATIFPQTQVDLSLSGTASPVTLHSSAGADITITAGPGISLSANAGNLTITNTGDSNAGDDITGTLASTQIAYGSSTNTITGNANFTYNAGAAEMRITGGIPSVTLNATANYSGFGHVFFYNSAGRFRLAYQENISEFRLQGTDAAGNFTVNPAILAKRGASGNKVGFNLSPGSTPAGQIQVNGSGSTSGTYTAVFHNSTGTSNSLLVRDDGVISIGTTPGQQIGKLNIELSGGVATSHLITFTNAYGWSNRWIKNYQSNSRRGILIGGKGLPSEAEYDILRIDHYPSGRVAIDLPTTIDSRYKFEVSGGSNEDGIAVSRSDDINDVALFNTNSEGDGILRSKSGNWTLSDLDFSAGSINPSSILHLFGPSGATEDNILTLEKHGGFGNTGFFQYYSEGNLGLKIRRFNNTTLYKPWITTWSNNQGSIFRVGINEELPTASLHVSSPDGGYNSELIKAYYTNTTQGGGTNAAILGDFITGSALNNVTTAYGVKGRVIMNNIGNTNNPHIGIRGDLEANNSGTYNGPNYSAGAFFTSHSAGSISNWTTMSSILSNLSTGAGSIGKYSNIHVVSSIDGNATDHTAINIETTNGSGTIQNDFGIRIKARKGVLKYGIYIDQDDLFVGGKIGVNVAPTRSIDVNGEVRIRDLVTTTGTKILLSDNDGVLSNAQLGSGLTLQGGVLSASLSGTGAFLNGGNSFVADAVLGTNDHYPLIFETNGTERIRIDDDIPMLTLQPTTEFPTVSGSLFYSDSYEKMMVVNDGVPQIIATSSDLTGESSLGSSNFSLAGDVFFTQADANTNSITISVGSSMKPGRTYLVRCRRNTTNTITINAESGFSLGIDGDTTLTPSSYTCGVAEVIRLTLYPNTTTIIIDK